MRELYNKFANWICHFESDKYMHFIVSMLLTFLIGILIAAIFHDGLAIAATIGCIATIIVGATKEILDFFFEGEIPDIKDLTADFFGCLIGFFMLMAVLILM